jgi:flagellar biosynthesis protein FlhF
MKMKQIQARDMKDAMRLARAELGEDAVLLDSKKVAGGGIIVTFAIDETEPLAFDDIPFEDPQPYIPRSATPQVEIDHPAYAIAAEALTQHGLPETIQARLLKRLKGTRFIAGGLIDVAENALADALAAEYQFTPITTGQTLMPARAIMLVGMHGAGKTSALAKLATELTLHKKPVAIISADNERIGAADTLAGLCGLLKCAFHVAEDRAALKPLLKQYAGNAWVLIDSTGVNIYEFQQLKALGELAGLNDVEPILTCPAGMDGAEAEEMARVLSFLGIDRMIATKVDATRRLSSLFAAQAAGGLALANISNSAKPTQACQPASPASLARLMLRHVRERTA